ncbi:MULTISPECIES: aldo/keto reductase [unclassified Clostridium]|uniref:aldo/keto reductase n=1 Tax=Clostridium TaxID=1485 RepID=UPI001C8CD3A7|nr:MULTISPECIES: aldo/keto reductase [unclassified Clostridium]MBX9138372.1 aldo/keto reductase family oxidoreductase [Clostridium sp. K12(2020)]MBX9145135.1 aldo/keto reductase family oxidoreductase [Clostridium sp. K13]MDU2291715.1 aldo/keto reductase [Clostridium celatum]MDU4325727.1 aldo/keto reductase [Clostridium celatum]
MKEIIMANGNIKASEIGLGCMRIAKLDKNTVNSLINTALDCGINFFDHADIYGAGKSEEIFNEAISLTPSLREKIIIQSKCSIRSGMYDFSKDYIINSVDGILKRLNTEYLDILLLHRPDTLMEPEEVNEAFEKLYKEGKVRNFGVSNHNAMQIELLNKYLTNKVTINQLQFSIMHTGIIDSGINVNMKNSSSIDRDGSILEYCRLKDINIQAWSPYQYGFFEGTFIDNPKFPELNKKLAEIADKYNVSKTAIATAWILRHPAKIQTIVGTTNKNRLRDICTASNVNLTRQEWYEIYLSAGNMLP